MGSVTNGEKTSTPAKNEDTNMNVTATPEPDRKSPEPLELSKDAGDDGGEDVVEGGEEDTVIY